jgi:hypothetical protein
MVDTPSPESGVFRWAWYRAKEFRGRFWVAAAVFSLIVALIVSRLPLPPHPTSTQNLIATVLAIVGATIMTGVGSYVCALVAAPFQQRNALRSQLSESKATIAALRARSRHPGTWRPTPADRRPAPGMRRAQRATRLWH